MKRCIIFYLLGALLCSNTAIAGCHGRFINPLTDVCWRCLFPLTLGGSALVKGKLPDTKNPKNPVCACTAAGHARIGLTIGFWEPIRLVDVTRTPFCFVSLGGLHLNMPLAGAGTVDNADPSIAQSFYHVHWYMFPLMYWLNLISDAVCVDSGQMDIAYVTELDPTWKNDELAFILNPEAGLFTSSVAHWACAPETIKLTAGGLPSDALFWCAGGQGNMYPLTGHVGAHVGAIQASTLLAERMTFKLHRLGLLKDSRGNSAQAVCRGLRYTPILPASRYRYQMTYPLPAKCKPFGYPTVLWGSGHTFPVAGEDFGYLIWRKRNCCAL